MSQFNLPRFEGGKPLLQQLSASRLNAILDYVDRNRPQSGDGTQAVRTPGGVIIRAKSAGDGASTEDPDIAFFISDATTTEDGEATNKIKINPGKVNDEFPAGMSFDEDYIIDMPEPDGSFIIVLMTYDPDVWTGGSEGVLSRDIQVVGPGDEYPEEGEEDGVGTKVQQLAFTYFDTDGDWRIHMTYVGDIDFPASGGDSNVIATEFETVSNVDTAGEELLYSHNIGANRLISNGDSIRAEYGVSIGAGEDEGSNLSLRFGAGSEGDLVIAGTSGDSEINLDFPVEIKIEALIMRSGSNAYRAITVISATIYPSDTSGLTSKLFCSNITDEVSSFADDLALTLWGGGESAGQVRARMALIEYIPA